MDEVEWSERVWSVDRKQIGTQRLDLPDIVCVIEKERGSSVYLSMLFVGIDQDLVFAICTNGLHSLDIQHQFIDRQFINRPTNTFTVLGQVLLTECGDGQEEKKNEEDKNIIHENQKEAMGSDIKQKVMISPINKVKPVDELNPFEGDNKSKSNPKKKSQKEEFDDLSKKVKVEN